jgi:hypothetical protein
VVGGGGGQVCRSGVARVGVGQADVLKVDVHDRELLVTAAPGDWVLSAYELQFVESNKNNTTNGRESSIRHYAYAVCTRVQS